MLEFSGGGGFKISDLNFIIFIALSMLGFGLMAIYMIGYAAEQTKIVEKRLRKLNEKLSEANARLKGISKLKSDFISVTSHQLRTPLSAVKWGLKIILEGDVGQINPEQKDLLDKTYQSNERMIILINDLLNVSRIESGRFGYRFKKGQIDKVINQAVEELEHEIKTRKIKYSFKKPSFVPKVLMDSKRMRLTIQNLIENAIRYNKEKGKIEVVIEVKEKNRELLLRIKDSGVGIPVSQQKHIFSKFFRASNVIRMQTEGSGLGLFIVKNIIERHKGKIWFKSEEGKGTTFYISLPVAESQFEEFMEKF